MNSISKGKYILAQVALTLVSPISSMCVAVRYYRNPISLFFILVFAFYFGMHIWLGNDATDHYVEMRLYYVGYSFSEIYNNPVVFLHSPEPYGFLLKYVISRFTTSPAIFGGVIATIYTILLLNFLTAFKKIYQKGLTVLMGLLLLLSLFVVEYTWYQGVRFWPGAMFFMGFYMRYVLTKRWHYMLIACLCPIFHYTLFVLPVAVLLNHFLMKLGWKLHVLIFLLSFGVRAMHVDFVVYLFSHVPILDSFFGELVMGGIDRQEAVQMMGEMRQEANVIYSFRSEAIALGLFLVMVMLRMKRVRFEGHYKLFMAFALTMSIIANVEHVDITFYDRFFKFAVWLFAIAVFFLVAENKNMLNGHSLFVIFSVAMIFLFALLTNVVAMRDAYFNMELWFGNFFIDWHGGLEEAIVDRWRDLFL